MQPINQDSLLIEHNIMLGIKHVVMVPASFQQEVYNHRAEYAGLSIHGNHGLPLMCLVNYLTYIVLVAAFQEYHNFAMTNRTDNRIFFAESDGYPGKIVQRTTVIDKLKVGHGDCLYACSKTGLDCKQGEAQSGLRQMRRPGC